MADLQAIATALAAVVGTVVATSGTESRSLTCTADLPDSIATEALLVYPPEEATLALILGPRFDDHYIYVIRYLGDPLSTPARTRWLYAWATALRPRVQTNVDLDVAGVVQAEMTSMRVALDGQQYTSAADAALRDFDVVEIPVDVHVLQNTTASI